MEESDKPGIQALAAYVNLCVFQRLMKVMSERDLGGAHTYVDCPVSDRAWSLIRDGGRVTSVR